MNEEDKWIEDLQSIELPEWLAVELPEKREVYTIGWDEDFIVTNEEGEIIDHYETFAEAYDSYDSSDDVVLDTDPSVDGHGGHLVAGSFNEEGENFSRFFPTVTDDAREALLKSSYNHWLTKTHPRWLEKPNSWSLSYRWLMQHPVFWYRYEDEKTWNWTTDNGLHSLWHGLDTSAAKPVWMFEHGAHVAPAYTQHYHDLRLDVYALSFEEGLVELANLVHKFFDEFGVEREGVEYEKSELELILEERLSEYEDAKKREEDSK